MKILVVLPRFPYPLEKGDKLRAFNQIRCLSQMGNEIYLFCVSHKAVSNEAIEIMRRYCKEVVVAGLKPLSSYYHLLKNFVSVKSVQMGYWDSRHSRRAYKAFEKAVQPDVIYSQMLRTMPLVARSLVPKVMDFQDSLSLNMERRMKASKKGLRHAAYHFEFKMLRSTEYNSFHIFDALTIISEPDCNAIPHQKNGEIHIIPNGVDLDYFHPMEAEKKYDIAFCGNMQYEPNVRTSVYLAEQVMPLVWKQIPNATLLLAGATPKAAVRRLANDRISVSGSVADIRDSYASAQVFCAPMQSGSGLQNKLLEAMAMKLPCITSSLANDSLKAEADKEVLVGDSPQEVADHIIDLLQSKQERETLAQAGFEYVTDHYSWETYCRKLNDILFEASKRKL